MKFNRLWIPVSLIIFVALAVLWKLNDYYRSEQTLTRAKSLEQQSAVLQNSISEFLNVRKSTLIGFENGIVETNINWLQFKPFFVVARGEVKDQKINLTEAVVNTDSVGRTWSAAFLNQALSYFKIGDEPIATKLFKNKSGQKFITLIFQYPQIIGPGGGRVVLAISAEAEIFQRFFQTTLGGDFTHSLLTSDQIVAGHTSSSYVATVSKEGATSFASQGRKILPLRGTDLRLVSYINDEVANAGFVIPLSIVGIVVGAVLVLIGIIAFAYAPIESYWRQQKSKSRQDEYRKTLSETKKDLTGEENVEAVEISASEARARKQVEEQIAVHRASGRESKRVEVADEVIEDEALFAALSEVKHNKLSLSSEASSPISNGKIGELGRYQISKLLALALQRQSKNITEARISVSSDLQSSAEFDLDPDRFVKAITNLLQNAIEAVRDRERREISVVVQDREGGVNVIIRDSGAGVKPADLDRIWQPFFTTKNKKQHKGLGLSEAISIARRYGFDVQLKNSQTGGAIVEIVMDQAKTIAGIEKSALSSSSSQDLTRASGSSSTVLIENKSESEIEMEIEKILNLEDESLSEMKPLRTKMTEESDPNIEVIPETPRVPSPASGDWPANLFSNQDELGTAATTVDFELPSLHLSEVVVGEKENRLQVEPNLNLNLREKEIDQVEIKIRRPTLNRDRSP